MNYHVNELVGDKIKASGLVCEEEGNPFLIAFESNPTGIDPRYSECFIAIKFEIDKLQNTDFSLIKNKAELILKNESKDIRVCGYYTLAMAYLYGVAGLIDGLNLYYNILNIFGSLCYPYKSDAKIHAIKWMNNRKFLHYINNESHEISSVDIDGLRTAVDEFNSIVEIKFPNKELEINVFNKFIDDKGKDSLIVSSSKKNDSEIIRGNLIDNANSNGNHITTANNLAKTISRVDDIKLDDYSVGNENIHKISRAVIKYYFDDNDWGRSFEIARALKWSFSSISVIDNTTTHINPPRKIKIKAIDDAFSKKRFEEAIRFCEELFLEDGGNFCLDIQKTLYDSLLAIKEIEHADLIAMLMNRFIEKMGIDFIGYRYIDGTCFASDKTKVWIRTLVETKGSNAVVESPINAVIKESHILMSTHGLAKAINVFDEYHCFNEKEKVMIELEKALLCINDGKHEVASVILEKLYKRVMEDSLCLWDRDLSVKVLRNYWSVLRMLCTVEEDVNYCLKENEVLQDLCAMSTNDVIEIFEVNNN